MVIVLAILMVSTMILAAFFGSVLYLFGFGTIFIVCVVQSHVIGVWYLGGQAKPVRSREAIVGQAFFILIALLAIGVGIYDVFLK